VPRHLFVPETVWVRDPGAAEPALVPVRRRDEPERWLALVYADDALVTQVDEGRPVAAGREATSSASQPSVVALMLGALDAGPGTRVCEIGTGTGWNTALLAHRLGAANVTTIEVDPALAAAARESLRAHGYGAVTCVRGDGAAGHPAGAPYDRVIATVCVYRVPPAWVAQTRPGGKVLTPWRTEYYHGGLLSLTVGEDGTAVGGVVANVAFMVLRDQRGPRTALPDTAQQAARSRTVTDLHPRLVTAGPDAAFAIGLRVPRCRTVTTPADPGTGTVAVWFLDAWSGSWARLDQVPDAAEFEVCQAGPRELWTEVAAAYRWWRDAGRPRVADWRVTVTPTTQDIAPP
jgi:protein-L-isoaspartate(D-aspartate) O-methyltransferase